MLHFCIFWVMNVARILLEICPLFMFLVFCLNIYTFLSFSVAFHGLQLRIKREPHSPCTDLGSACSQERPFRLHYGEKCLYNIRYAAPECTNPLTHSHTHALFKNQIWYMTGNCCITYIHMLDMLDCNVWEKFVRNHKCFCTKAVKINSKLYTSSCRRDTNIIYFGLQIQPQQLVWEIWVINGLNLSTYICNSYYTV